MQIQMNVNDIFENGIKLPYVYFRTVSEVYIGKKENITYDIESLVKNTVLHEIRFFDDTDEYRLYFYDGALHGIHTSDDGTDDSYIVRRKYKIENQKKFGKTIDVCCYIDSDDDGQNYIAYSRFCGWSDNDKRRA